MHFNFFRNYSVWKLLPLFVSKNSEYRYETIHSGPNLLPYFFAECASNPLRANRGIESKLPRSMQIQPFQPSAYRAINHFIRPKNILEIGFEFLVNGYIALYRNMA